MLTSKIDKIVLKENYLRTFLETRKKWNRKILILLNKNLLIVLY